MGLVLIGREILKVRKTEPVKKETAPQNNNIEKEAPREEEKGKEQLNVSPDKTIEKKEEKKAPVEEKSAPIDGENLKVKPPSESVRSFGEAYKEFYNVISEVDLTSGATDQFIDQAKELIKAAESLIKKGEKKEAELENLNETLNKLEKGNKQ